MINEKLIDRLVEHLMRQEEVRSSIWHYTAMIIANHPETVSTMIPTFEKHVNASVETSYAFQKTLIALIQNPDNGLVLESQEIKQIEDQQSK